MFNNADGTRSPALEYALDESGLVAERVWEYGSEFGSVWLGDVQRLTNGNTLVTYSSNGVMHEVDADGKLVQSRSWALGAGLGYVMRRPTLYGPPPK